MGRRTMVGQDLMRVDCTKSSIKRNVCCRKFVRGDVCVYSDCGKSMDAVGNCVSSQWFDLTVRISDVFEFIQ